MSVLFAITGTFSRKSLDFSQKYAMVAKIQHKQYEFLIHE